MAYTVYNFKTKKALKNALKAGDVVRVCQEGQFGPNVEDGPVYLEGPHYPAQHSWYAIAVVKDGVIVGKVK